MDGDHYISAFSGEEIDAILTAGFTASGNTYSSLPDKPRINGVELNGNLTSDQLGMLTVSSVAGKTGDVELDKNDVGLSNVDNTSDIDKPVSTAVNAALEEKADIEDPEFIRSISIQGNDGQHRIGEGGNSSGRTEIQNTRFGTKRCLIIGEDELRYRIGDDLTEHKVYSENNPPPVDAELSRSSTNPVQNKVVKTELSKKADINSPYFYEDAIFNGGAMTSFSPKYTVSVNDDKVELSYKSSKSPIPDKIIFGDGSLKFQTSNQEYDVYTSLNPLPVDSALSSTSENPVQNKVVKAELDGKMDKVPKSVTVEDPDSFVTVKIIPGEIGRYGEARFVAKDTESDSYMAIIMDPHIGTPLSFEQKIALKEMESGVIYTSLNPQTTMCGFSFASMTQEEYDALAEKDENTIYLVV